LPRGRCRAIRPVVPATGAGWPTRSAWSRSRRPRTGLVAHPDQPDQISAIPCPGATRRPSAPGSPRVVIDRAQGAEAPAAGQPVGHEVERSAQVRSRPAASSTAKRLEPRLRPPQERTRLQGASAGWCRPPDATTSLAGYTRPRQRNPCRDGGQTSRRPPSGSLRSRLPPPSRLLASTNRQALLPAGGALGLRPGLAPNPTPSRPNPTQQIVDGLYSQESMVQRFSRTPSEL